MRILSVPWYFFDFHDGRYNRDGEGQEFENLRQVRKAAKTALAEIGKDIIPTDGDNHAVTVMVRDESNHTIYTATLSLVGLWTMEDPPTG